MTSATTLRCGSVLPPERRTKTTTTTEAPSSVPGGSDPLEIWPSRISADQPDQCLTTSETIRDGNAPGAMVSPLRLLGDSFLGLLPEVAA